MAPIRVVVSNQPGTINWRALVRAIRTESGLRVFTAGSKKAIEKLLRRREPHVLIVEYSGESVDPAWDRYLDENPGLMIIAIHPESADLIIRRRDARLGFLIQVLAAVSDPEHLGASLGGFCPVQPDDLRALVAPAPPQELSSISANPVEPGLDPELGKPEPEHLKREHHQQQSEFEPQQEPEPELELQLEPEPRTRPKPDSEQVIHRPPSSGASGGYVSDDAWRWLDASLHLRLRRDVQAEAGPGIPTWAMTAGRASTVLGGSCAGLDEAELLVMRAQLAQVAFDPDSRTGLTCVTENFANACDAFGLQAHERRLLFLAIAAELDGRYAKVFGFLNDDLTRRRPTATLAGEILDPERAAWQLCRALSLDTAIGLHGLLTLAPDDPHPSSEAALVVAPEVVAFVLADLDVTPHYASFVQVSRQAASRAAARATRAEGDDGLDRWIGRVETDHLEASIAHVSSDSAGFRRRACRAGVSVVTLSLTTLVATQTPLRAGALAAARVAALYDAILLVTGRNELTPECRRLVDGSVVPALYRRWTRLAVDGDGAWIGHVTASVWHVEREYCSALRRASQWLECARVRGVEMTEGQASDLAACLQFDESRIEATLRLQVSTPEMDTRAAARCVARTDAPGAVNRVEPTYTWDDIVLPEDLRKQLESIPRQVRLSGTVLDDWGYRARLPYGQAVAALFSGRSGCGKTMAAQVIANDLGVDLYQVDLSKTCSKYIGETEKNLDQVFEAAEAASAVLLFDEAEALFGKRTEVRDAHDRHANVEVAYLLQRMESFRGVAILTTNFRQNLDRAFTRRLACIAEFSLPDAGDRELIWARSFPPNAPLEEDLEKSFAFLARRLELTGGSIQKISTRAAYAAAAEGHCIALRHVVDATREELRKIGMVNAEKILEGLAA